MSIETLERQARSPKQRLKRAFRRTRKAPIRILQRFQGYDNSQPIRLEPFNAIYFPVARVASSTLMTLFKKELGLPGLGPHLARFQIANRDRLEAGFYLDYFKFCFVRNPWERILSCYHSKIINKQNINQTFQTRCLFYVMPKSVSSGRHRLASLPVLNAHMSFEEFVHAVANIQDEYADKHFRGQHTFICNARGELLVDYIGHLETFKDDFQYVARRVGLSEGLQHKPKRMRRHYKKRRHYKDYYNKETWEIVAGRYRKDIELLGYQECRL